MSSNPLELLENFTEQVKKEIPLSRVWITKRKVEKLSFKQVAAEQAVGIPFVNSEVKALLARDAIPFTVTAVSDEHTTTFPESARRMKEVSQVVITIQFTDEQLTLYDVHNTMRLSLTTRDANGDPYEGRVKLLDALREDVKEAPVEGVILTGDKNWYGLGAI